MSSKLATAAIFERFDAMVKDLAPIVSTDLTCKYQAVPKKKGPKGKRTFQNGPRPTHLPYLLNQIPPTGHIAHDPPHFPEPNDTLELNAGNIPRQTEPALTQSIDSPPTIPQPEVEGMREKATTSFRPSPVVTDDLFKSCLDAFFNHKYPIMPVLDREKT